MVRENFAPDRSLSTMLVHEEGVPSPTKVELKYSFQVQTATLIAHHDGDIGHPPVEIEANNLQEIEAFVHGGIVSMLDLPVPR